MTTPQWRWKIWTKFPVFKPVAALCSHVYINARFHLSYPFPSLKNIFPADAYRNFCIAFGGHETLTHLTLQGNDQNDMLPILCEILRHPKCNLQYLRYISPSLKTSSMWTEFLQAYIAILNKVGGVGKSLILIRNCTPPGTCHRTENGLDFSFPLYWSLSNLGNHPQQAWVQKKWLETGYHPLSERIGLWFVSPVMIQNTRFCPVSSVQAKILWEQQIFLLLVVLWVERSPLGIFSTW